MTAEQVIKTLGAVGIAVAGYWFGLSAAIAPPDPESMKFLSIACSVGGLLLGGLMLAFRSRIDGRLVVAVIAVATVVGGGALFRYEHHRSQRVVEVSQVGKPPAVRVVTDVLSDQGFPAVLAGKTCRESEVRDRGSRQVTWACARRAAQNIPAADAILFDEEARAASRTILVVWYRLAAISLMLALFLVVDYFLAKAPPLVGRQTDEAQAAPEANPAESELEPEGEEPPGQPPAADD